MVFMLLLSAEGKSTLVKYTRLKCVQIAMQRAHSTLPQHLKRGTPRLTAFSCLHKISTF